MELDSNGNFHRNMPKAEEKTFRCLFPGMAIQLFSDVINLEQALLKSEAEDKKESSMWTERLSSERNKDVDEVAREEKVPPAEYESPPKTEAEAIFRLLDVNKQGFVTRKVTLENCFQAHMCLFLIFFCSFPFKSFLSSLAFYQC